jgi:hypothetical protein
MDATGPRGDGAASLRRRRAAPTAAVHKRRNGSLAVSPVAVVAVVERRFEPKRSEVA